MPTVDAFSRNVNFLSLMVEYENLRENLKSILQRGKALRNL